MVWSACSAFDSLDFYFCGHLKGLIYDMVATVKTRRNLTVNSRNKLRNTSRILSIVLEMLIQGMQSYEKK